MEKDRNKPEQPRRRVMPVYFPDGKVMYVIEKVVKVSDIPAESNETPAGQSGPETLAPVTDIEEYRQENSRRV
jgi:hypothetical protein